MNFQENLGGRIAYLRRQKNISQEKLALEAQIQRTYLGAIERGEKNITVAYLRKILATLGITLSDFFRGFDE